MKLGEAIAEIMKREGIEILCGYPVNHLIEYAAATDIRPVMCRQERVGVDMADGFARASGRSHRAANAMRSAGVMVILCPSTVTSFMSRCIRAIAAS